MIADKGMELHQAIYKFYLTQIQFGYYRYGEKLPALEEACRQFHTSLDTVNPAYHRLRQEGYISLSKKAGAKVTVKFAPEEIEQHIQTFYAERRESLFDLSSSIWPLLGQAQCYALKYGALTWKDQVYSADSGHLQSLYGIWKLLDRKYEVLGNELFMRLTRYLYLYFYGSFCNVIDNRQLKEKTFRQIQTAAALCLEGNWSELPETLRVIQAEFSRTLHSFYKERISAYSVTFPDKQPQGLENAFRWDAYERSAQLRYSLAMELLTEIGRGTYPVGSYLPSAERLSAEKSVSVSTVRRAICLLNSIGAVKSSRPLGARVLPFSQGAENCDFTHPDLRRRLLDLAESLQIFALSGKAVSDFTLAAMDDTALCQWLQYLHELKRREHCERVIYVSLFQISVHAPCQTLRTIYSELLRLLFWGYPLERIIRTKEEADIFFTPFIEHMITSLEQKEFHSFSSDLEFLLLHELRKIVDVLPELGIHEAEKLLIPDLNEF